MVDSSKLSQLKALVAKSTAVIQSNTQTRIKPPIFLQYVVQTTGGLSSGYQVSAEGNVGRVG